MGELKKTINFQTLLLITINSIMGTGIFFLPAVGAAKAGPASILSWVLLSLISMYMAMCFAELAGMFPKAGGTYEFCKQAFGRLPSFLIGWTTMIAGNITIAMLVVGAIQYLLPYDIPRITIPLSLFFILSFNIAAYLGMKTSMIMLVTFAYITLATLFSLIIPGAYFFDAGNLRPFFVFSPAMVFIAIFYIAETFFGWETVTFLSEETKDGARVVPRAIIIGTGIIALICLAFVVTSLGAMPWQQFSASQAPLADLSVLYYGQLGEQALTLMVYLAIIGSVAGWIVSAPRLILAMARDKLFLAQFAEIHPKHNTPHKAIILQTALTTVLVFAGAGSYKTLVELLVPIVLLLYATVMLSLVVMRFTKPDHKRTFTCPGGVAGASTVILFSLVLIGMWALESGEAWRLIKLGASLISFGFPIYLLLEMYYNPHAIHWAHNALAYLELLLERIITPKNVRNNIIKLMGNLKGKCVLEFGCGIGTMTLELAKKVGPKGKVFATDLSEKHIGITQKRIRPYKRVICLQDPKHLERLHPSIPQIDAVVSLGTLGYLQKVMPILKQMRKKLRNGSRICFLDYDKFFWFIPNTSWLTSDEVIRKMFKNAGFDVRVKRVRGILWQYIYIYGRRK